MLLVGTRVEAQYALTPVPPPTNFTFNDLWHFTILKTSPDNNQLYISLRIFDEKSSLKVKSNTSTFLLASGNHYYNLSSISQLQPFTTSYYDASLLQQAVSSGGYFPPGKYNVVYTLYGKSADGEFAPLVEESSEIIVEVMWPPILIWPPDNEVLDNFTPTLTWTPAFSSSYTGQITYDIKLVEQLKPGQSVEQSILSNPTFYEARNISDTYLPYPPSAPLLENEHTYVWQVTAHLGESRPQSQVWSFSYSSNQQRRSGSEPTQFSPVLEKLDASYAVANDGVLKIKYTEEYEVPQNSFLLYEVYDKYGHKIRMSLPPVNSPSAPIKKGDNYVTLDLTTGSTMSIDQFYTITVMNHKNEKWYLRFLYK